MHTLTLEREKIATEAPTMAPTCECGEVLYNGACFAVDCGVAAQQATRGASRATSKFAPAAWTSVGYPD